MSKEEKATLKKIDAFLHQKFKVGKLIVIISDMYGKHNVLFNKREGEFLDHDIKRFGISERDMYLNSCLLNILFSFAGKEKIKDERFGEVLTGMVMEEMEEARKHYEAPDMVAKVKKRP